MSLHRLLQVKNKPAAFPRNDQPWGVTRAFFDTDIVLPKWQLITPILEMVGEKKYRVTLKTPRGHPVLSVCHIYDADGNELVQDKDRDVKYTVLLNRKNPLPSKSNDDGEEKTLLPFITKKETRLETTFLIDTPPKVGLYKLQIYAVKRPKLPGKLKIPLIASFLVDYRHSLPPPGTGTGGGSLGPTSAATASLFRGAALQLMNLTSMVPMSSTLSAPSSLATNAGAPYGINTALVREAGQRFSQNLIKSRERQQLELAATSVRKDIFNSDTGDVTGGHDVTAAAPSKAAENAATENNPSNGSSSVKLNSSRQQRQNSAAGVADGVTNGAEMTGGGGAGSSRNTMSSVEID